MPVKLRRMAGFSLIELVMAIVIVGVGLSGVLLAFSTASRNSADPLVRKQMLAVGEEMLEEILLKPYAPASNPLAATCARDTWNDILDYDGYDSASTTCVSGGAAAATPTIYDMGGSAIATLSGYSVNVHITDVTLPASGANGVAAKKIVVTVIHGSTQSLKLTGWRTNYAA